jgi:hypothetical protein
MLDSFLEVAYNSDQKKQQAVKLASSLKNLPNDQLFALATGKAKLAFHHDEEWLEKYRGTPLFQEAMALEKADLENEVARTQASAAQPQMDQFWKTQDQIRIQKKMLDLKLVESEESGGMGLQDGGKLPEVVPATAQGAGALGDVPSEGAQQGEIGMQGAKVASRRGSLPYSMERMADAAKKQKGVGRLKELLTGERVKKLHDLADETSVYRDRAGKNLHRRYAALVNKEKNLSRATQAAAGTTALAATAGGAKAVHSLAKKKKHPEPTKEANFAQAENSLKGLVRGINTGTAVGGLGGMAAGAAHGFRKDEQGNRHIGRGIAETVGGGIGGSLLGSGAGGVASSMRQGQNLRNAIGETKDVLTMKVPQRIMDMGMNMGMKVASPKFSSALSKIALSNAALGGLIGSGVGALGGAMTGGSKDVVGPDGQVHKTKSHRLRNALIGAGAGGVAGAGIGHGVGKLRGASGGLAKAEQTAAGAVEPPKLTGYIPEDKPLFSASQFEPKKSVSPEDLPLREHIQMMGGNAPAAAKPDLSEIMNLPGGGLQPLQTPVAAPAVAAPALDLSGTGIPQKELSAVGFQQAKRPGILTRMFSPAQARFENAVADMGVKQAHGRMSLSMQKAALDMGALKSMGGKALEFARKNPGAVGAGLGAVTGALTAKRDPQTGEKHWVRGALGGAALGGAAGHAIGGIGNRLAQPGTSLGQAASGYAGDLKSKFQAGFDKLKNWTPTQAQPAQAQPVQQSLPGMG